MAAPRAWLAYFDVCIPRDEYSDWLYHMGPVSELADILAWSWKPLADLPVLSQTVLVSGLNEDENGMYRVSLKMVLRIMADNNEALIAETLKSVVPEITSPVYADLEPRPQSLIVVRNMAFG